MITLLNHWRVLTVIGVCLGAIGMYLLGKHDARQQAALDAAEATIEAIQKRAKVDEKIIGMDGVALCLELGGLQPDCEQLRRLEQNQP